MPNRKPLILVADDETHILHVVTHKLRHAGYDVITAEDGQEALELALARQPDLVITDYQMPFLSGLELCRRLKDHAPTSATPALMLTAHGFGMATEELERTNIAAVLSKPFSPREVLARVQDLIGEKAPQEADKPS
jgi:two-component system, OmpR family, alkaline phosphatase synthesis response regulator PhoP